MPDPKIINSPFSQFVERDDQRVQVCIYRLESEPRWSLEIVARDDTSTVWDDLFENDSDAYAEVMNAIEEDGIASFLMDPKARMH